MEKKVFKILTCLKQVPDTSDIKWTKENNIVRDGLLSVLNPPDEYVLELTRCLKKKLDNVEATSLSMGPIQAKAVLEYSLARGCDFSFLLNDKKFTGSDTLATSKVLCAFVKEFLADFDLILCSKGAIDGETSQTPPSLAELLGVEFVSNVLEIIEIENEKIILKQKTDCGHALIEANLPIVLSVVESDALISCPMVQDYIKAQDKEIKVLGVADIKIDENDCGIKGSPTYVSKVFRPVVNRKLLCPEGNFANFIYEKINNVMGGADV